MAYLAQDTLLKVYSKTTYAILVCAYRFLSTRIKMTGYIKSENVADWAGMWLRIDSKTQGELIPF